MNDHSLCVFAGKDQRVAVLSLSGSSDAAAISRGAERLHEHFDVLVDPRAFGRMGYLAGGDEARARSLIDALEDPSVKAIFCARGGYGITRVLEVARDRIEQALRRNPKPIVGFSDVTALHSLWHRVGVRSIHGAMVARMGTEDGVLIDDLQSILDSLAGRSRPMQDLVALVAGDARGYAAGSNLAMLTSLLATPDQYALDGAILFLEDVGERPYRVDRMLTQLRASKTLSKVRAIVLGDWSQCDPGPDGVCVQDVLRERLGTLGVPVYANGPFGHSRRAQAFALGDEVMLHASGELEFALPGTVC